ncbi:hypothetical protein LTR08_005392 [Meristemomyces frigidus]|nr:hypothetical protein LTR08_005392 [Meristemomyces frigidus]
MFTRNLLKTAVKQAARLNTVPLQAAARARYATSLKAAAAPILSSIGGGYPDGERINADKITIVSYQDGERVKEVVPVTGPSLRSAYAASAILDVQQDTGEKAARELSEQTGVDVRFYQVDVRDAGAMSQTIEDIVAHYGALNMLTNAAGIAE